MLTCWELIRTRVWRSKSIWTLTKWKLPINNWNWNSWLENLFSRKVFSSASELTMNVFWAMLSPTTSNFAKSTNSSRTPLTCPTLGKFWKSTIFCLRTNLWTKLLIINFIRWLLGWTSQVPATNGRFWIRIWRLQTWTDPLSPPTSKKLTWKPTMTTVCAGTNFWKLLSGWPKSNIWKKTNARLSVKLPGCWSKTQFCQIRKITCTSKNGENQDCGTWIVMTCLRPIFSLSSNYMNFLRANLPKTKPNWPWKTPLKCWKSLVSINRKMKNMGRLPMRFQKWLLKMKWRNLKNMTKCSK